MKRIGRYTILGKLGRGGMSTVYKAAMPVTKKIVALKLLAPAETLVEILGMAELVRLFTAEAVTMAGIRHPGIADVRDFDHDQRGRPFYVMEYYCKDLGQMIGETFKVEQRSRILAPDKVLQYGRQVLDGLSCLHQAGIIHRDIKPFNILLTDQDSTKICDFGLSRQQGDAAIGHQGVNIGSAYYTSPEQETNPDEVDGRSDLYAVGVMLYRMVTGRLPQGSKPASSLNPLLDEAWDIFFSRAMAPKSKRYTDAAAMLDGLVQLQDHWQQHKENACRFHADAGHGVAESGPRQYLCRDTAAIVDLRRARNIFAVDGLWRPREYIANLLQDNGNGTITDHATGLLWQQSGSDYPRDWEQAGEYLRDLRQRRFGDCDGWRLPTVNELMSLLTEPTLAEQYCLAPVFDAGKRWLWSGDRRSASAAWYVSADLGFVGWQDTTCFNFIRAVCSRREFRFDPSGQVPARR